MSASLCLHDVDLTANYTCSHLWLNGVVVYGHESVVDSVVSGFPLDCVHVISWSCQLER